MPIAASSMMSPAIVSGVVSPGSRIMSSPTEQTAVIASSFSSESVPRVTASESTWSSMMGMKTPERPPTALEAKAPPFLTASLSSMTAAVVPGAPTRSTPMAW